MLRFSMYFLESEKLQVRYWFSETHCCSEQKFRYMCLSAVLVCSLAHNLPFLIFIIRSRNGISVGEISFVNFMVGCTVFKWFINFKSYSFPCGHIKKISSMNIFHDMGCRGYVYTPNSAYNENKQRFCFIIGSFLLRATSL